MAQCFASAGCEVFSVARSLSGHQQSHQTFVRNAAPISSAFTFPLPHNRTQRLPQFQNARVVDTSYTSSSVPALRSWNGVKARRVQSVRSSMQAVTQSAGRVGARESGSVPLDKLVEVVTNAAKTGAGAMLEAIDKAQKQEQSCSAPTSNILNPCDGPLLKNVVMERVDKPRTVDFKGATDLVTDTDKATEDAILAVIKEAFPDHLVLGEEGGVSGGPNSDYLWCIDPLDGTTNFTHSYPCFAVSVAVLWKGRPIAGSVVEFAGGPFCWVTRTFSATAGGGAFCEGQRIHVSDTDSVQRSLLVTGFGYEHDDAWSTNIDLFKHFTDVSRGVRRLGAAAVDLCHVALGLVDAYWEYRLKPWDMAAGVLIAEEAGATVTRMDGKDFTVFDRSVIASNGKLHSQLLDVIEPATKQLLDSGKFVDDLWFKPDGYTLK